MEDDNTMKFALEWPDKLKQRLKLNNEIIKDSFKDKDFIDAVSKQVSLNLTHSSKRQDVAAIKKALRGKSYNKGKINSILNSKIKALELIKATLVEDAAFEKQAWSDKKDLADQQSTNPSSSSLVSMTAEINQVNGNLASPQHSLDDQQPQNDDLSDKKKKPVFVYRVYKLRDDFSYEPERLEVPTCSILDIKHNPSLNLSKLTSVTNFHRFQYTLYSYYYALMEDDPLTVYCQHFENNILCNQKIAFKNTEDMRIRIKKRLRYHCLTHHFKRLDLNRLFETVNPMLWSSIRLVLKYKKDLSDEEKQLRIEQASAASAAYTYSPETTEPTDATTPTPNTTTVNPGETLDEYGFSKGDLTVVQEFISEKEADCEKKLKEMKKVQNKYETLFKRTERLKAANKSLTEKVKNLKSQIPKKTKSTKVATTTTVASSTTSLKTNKVTKSKKAPKKKAVLNRKVTKHNDLSNENENEEPIIEGAESNNTLLFAQNNSFVSSPPVLNDNFNNLMNAASNNESMSVMSPMYHDNNNYGLQMNPNEYQSRLPNTNNQVMIPPLDINSQTQFNGNSVSIQAGQPRLPNPTLLNNTKSLGGKPSKPVISPAIRNINNLANNQPNSNSKLGYNNW